MAITLGIWAPKNGRGSPRIYVNGLRGRQIDSQSKVFLERNRSGGVEVMFQGERAPFDEAEVLKLVAEHLYGDPTKLALTWEDVFARTSQAKTLPARRGSAPGSRASSAPKAFAVPTQADFDMLDPDMVTNPIPETTRIIVDHREPIELVELLRRVRGLEVMVDTLEVGDILCPDVLVIERKCVSDFVTSTIDDQRLFYQAAAMNETGLRTFMILEGDVYNQTRMELPSIDGMLSYLMAICRIPVFSTRSLAHTAKIIAKFVRHSRFGLGYGDPALTAPGSPKLATDTSVRMLTTVPGVSAIIASRLIKQYGTVANVCRATEPELRCIPGIGPAVAAKIVKGLGSQPELQSIV